MAFSGSRCAKLRRACQYRGVTGAEWICRTFPRHYSGVRNTRTSTSSARSAVLRYVDVGQRLGRLTEPNGMADIAARNSTTSTGRALIVEAPGARAGLPDSGLRRLDSWYADAVR